MSVSSSLLFDHCLWLLLLMPCLGLILTYFTKRTKPYRKNGKIYRHDVAARVEHWPHALGTLFLLISGIIMGLSFFISFVSTSEEAVIALNVHFVAACAFLFGTFYYIGNAISEPARMKEHLPNKDAISSTMNHYGAQLGFKRAKYPKEKKYFQSENMAYVFAIFVGALMAFTGIIKSIQHSIDLPGFVVSAVARYRHGCHAPVPSCPCVLCGSGSLVVEDLSLYDPWLDARRGSEEGTPWLV